MDKVETELGGEGQPAHTHKQRSQTQKKGLWIPRSMKMCCQEVWASNSFHYTSCFFLEYLHHGKNNAQNSNPNSEKWFDFLPCPYCSSEKKCYLPEVTDLGKAEPDEPHGGLCQSESEKHGRTRHRSGHQDLSSGLCEGLSMVPPHMMKGLPSLPEKDSLWWVNTGHQLLLKKALQIPPGCRGTLRSSISGFFGRPDTQLTTILVSILSTGTVRDVFSLISSSLLDYRKTYF